MSPAPILLCSTHADAPAGWRCSLCDALLCPSCAVRRISGSATIPSCSRCGAFAEVLTGPRELGPVGGRLLALVRYPLAGDAKHLFLVSVVILGVLNLLWLPGALLSDALLAAMVFHIVQATGNGATEPPGFSDSSSIFDFVGAILKLVTCLGLSLVPVGLVAWLVYGGDVGRALANPVLWPFVALGVLWTPMAVLFVAVGSPLTGALNPFNAWEGARRLGREFVYAAAVFWSAFGLWYAMDAALVRLCHGLPVLPNLLGLPGKLYLAMVGAHVLGRLVWARGGLLGHGRGDEHYDPVLGATGPAGELSMEPASAHLSSQQVPAPVQPIELSDDPSMPFADFVSFQPTDASHALELSPEPARPLPVRPHFAAPPPAAPAAPAASDDLMSEEEFMKTVFPGGPDESNG